MLTCKCTSVWWESCSFACACERICASYVLRVSFLLKLA